MAVDGLSRRVVKSERDNSLRARATDGKPVSDPPDGEEPLEGFATYGVIGQSVTVVARGLEPWAAASHRARVIPQHRAEDDARPGTRLGAENVGFGLAAH